MKLLNKRDPSAKLLYGELKVHVLDDYYMPGDTTWAQDQQDPSADAPNRLDKILRNFYQTEENKTEHHLSHVLVS